MFSAVATTLSAVEASTRRLEVVASNVANVDSTGSLPTASRQKETYAPVRVVQTSIPGPNGGTVATDVRRLDPATQPRLEPAAAHADGRGLVAAPAVDVADQMHEGVRALQQAAASALSFRAFQAMIKRLFEDI
ncbi:MAG: flagellar basal body rod protein FlgC [Hyphomicrobiaceae bacterium]